MSLTAAAGSALVTATQSADKALSAAISGQKDVGDAWMAAYEKIVATMTALLKNLEGKLKKDDTRWLAFGLQIPATIKTPGQPQNVTAHTDGLDALVMGCDAVPTAGRYRFRMMILLVASSTEPIASINNKILPGQTVQIIVQAVSGNLQGKASEPIVFTIPVGTVKSAPLTEAAAPAETLVPTLASSGNGHPSRLPALS